MAQPSTSQPKRAKKTTKIAEAPNAVEKTPVSNAATASMGEPSGTAEAKTRFTAALDEAKAGAAALKDEATTRASAYKTQAKFKSEGWSEDAKTKAGELAVDGKGKASDALAALSQTVADNAAEIDSRFGAKYGDYARSAARSLQESATKLDEKSVDELSNDAREMVRKSPGAAVGVAAVAGFFIARLFGGRKG